MDFEVVYNAALERELVRAQQAQAAAVPGGKWRARIVEALTELGDATLPELAGYTGIDGHIVNGALYAMQDMGLVEIGPRVALSAFGRRCRTYRLVAL